MKKVNILQINDKKYELYYTIGDLRKIERETGRSLISTIMTGDTNKTGIDFIISAIRHGIHNKEIYGDAEIEDFIDEYCSQEGVFTLDALTATILTAIYETGFFTPSAPAKKQKMEEKK